MENHREELAQKGLKAFQREFLVIGKTHIRAWHAWLVLGIVAGAVGGVLFVANRGGFEGIFAGVTKQQVGSLPVINPPVVPMQPPEIILPGQSASFTFSATDADSDDLVWWVNWGDGTITAWNGVTEMQGTEKNSSDLEKFIYACQEQHQQNQQGWTFNTSHAFGFEEGTEHVSTVEASVWDCNVGNKVIYKRFQLFVGEGKYLLGFFNFKFPSSLYPGQVVNAQLSANNGYPPGYIWTLSGNPPPGITLVKSPTCMNCAQFNGSSQTSGSYTFKVELSDGTQNTSRQITTTVTEPLSVSCLVSPISIKEGESATWTASISGGVGPYNYSWSGTSGLSGNSQSVTMTYAAAGTKTASIKVTGSGGQKVTQPCSNSLTVTTPPPPPPPPSTPSTINILSPNGGESWRQKSTQKIKWSDTNSKNAKKVSIDLVSWVPPCDTEPCSQQPISMLSINKETDNDGLFEWTISKNIPVGKYLIRIMENANPQVFDYSDNPFNIVQ